MKRLLFTKILLFTALIVASQNDPIKGRYGKNDIRIRAGNGSIEEGRLNKFDFKKSGLSKIAVIYWSDQNYGFQKIGITIFENSKQQAQLDSNMIKKNRDILSKRLDAVSEIKFKLIDTPSSINSLFKRKPLGSKVKLLNPVNSFLASLKSDGYDGLFIIYEDKFQDLITGVNGWIPSKGILKFSKKKLVYYGLYSTLIDLNTNQTVKNIGYKQLSADYSQIPFKKTEALTEEERNILKNELTIRFANNIDEIFRIHKINH